MFEQVYERGACKRSGNPEWFFSERPDELAAAQRVCEACPVRLPCLELALAENVEWGVWGGIVFWDGHAFYRKRGRGRPSRNDQGLPVEADRDELWAAVTSA